MPKSSNDRQRLICLARIFEKYSDGEHPLSVADICSHLAREGISVTRQTVYKDVEELVLLGYDIVSVRGKKYGYYLRSRVFDLAELKLMVDAVQSAKFIDGASGQRLIDKLSSLTSVHRAGKLKRQVYVREKKTEGMEQIYENIDLIHESIAQKKMIRYKYYDWSPEKKRVARHGGRYYHVTPLALVWDDENYYLVAYDGDSDEIKHFRVDKLGKVYITEDNAQSNEKTKALDLAKYSEQVFGMYSGRSELVTLICENRLAGVIIDKFGEDVTFFKEDGEHFSVSVRVMISPNFYSWVLMFRDKIRIKAPAGIAKEYADMLIKVAGYYEKNR